MQGCTKTFDKVSEEALRAIKVEWVCDKFVGKLLTAPSDFPKTPPIGR